MRDWIYDIETYPNVFTIAFEKADQPITASFEISDAVNQSREIAEFLKDNVGRMIGFNNIGFDYPVLHMLLSMGYANAATLYEKAQAIINSQFGAERDFKHLVPTWEHKYKQIDLFKIHHFDNKARSTSLKALQFVMKMDTLEDLPIPVGTILDAEQIKLLKKYNAHDVLATKMFYQHTLPMIEFRKQISEQTGFDYTNHNDTKIGKQFFINALMSQDVKCYDHNRQPIQTPRPSINLKDCILPWVKFKHEGLARIKDWLVDQTITDTKQAFENLSTTINGTEVIFGLGGIHASVQNTVVKATDDTLIIDLDVASYYPNLAITNKFYPQHLTEKFCDVYSDLFERRKQCPKGTAENAAYKLALNGVYGDSNNKFSPFYDPLFTMRITLNGQLLLCKLADMLIDVESLKVIQMNTDGVTVTINKADLGHFTKITEEWQRQLGLVLERTDYSGIWIRDVNNYLAVTTDGKVKRKGCYDYHKAWHQDHSALVIPKAAEQVLARGKSIHDVVTNWGERYDFMQIIKVNRDCKLSLTNHQGDREFIQRTSRYYISDGGSYMWKHMPPLKGKTVERCNAVEKGWMVTVCNDMKDSWKHPIDYDYYINEVEKLCLILK